MIINHKMNMKRKTKVYWCIFYFFGNTFPLAFAFQETARASVILNASSRESLVRETRSVLELVWAYNSGESERLCGELLNALKALEMNVNKKNRKDNISMDLSNTRLMCFYITRCITCNHAVFIQVSVESQLPANKWKYQNYTSP